VELESAIDFAEFGGLELYMCSWLVCGTGAVLLLASTEFVIAIDCGYWHW